MSTPAACMTGWYTYKHFAALAYVYIILLCSRLFLHFPYSLVLCCVYVVSACDIPYYFLNKKPPLNEAS